MILCIEMPVSMVKMWYFNTRHQRKPAPDSYSTAAAMHTSRVEGNTSINLARTWFPRPKVMEGGKSHLTAGELGYISHDMRVNCIYLYPMNCTWFKDNNQTSPGLPEIKNHRHHYYSITTLIIPHCNHHHLYISLLQTSQSPSSSTTASYAHRCHGEKRRGP